MLSMIFWLFITNLVYGIDSIIWDGNVGILAVVWCDITTKMIIGCNVALPAACLCVCIHLEQLASVRQAIATEQAKRRRQFFEAGMCFGLPVLIMALHYTVQGHRFDIIEDYGCRPTTYVSWPSILLIWVLPILLAVLTLGFACAAFAHFMRRRIDFARHLQHRSALTTSRYMRLIIMSVVEMFWGLAVTSYNLYTATFIYRPWIGWTGVHFDFSRIDLYSAVFMPQSQATELLIIWASVPVSSLIFVLFFAFGHDAMAEYRDRISWFKRCVLRTFSGIAIPGLRHSLDEIIEQFKTRLEDYRLEKKTSNPDYFSDEETVSHLLVAANLKSLLYLQGIDKSGLKSGMSK